jgi:hypothetical protein
MGRKIIIILVSCFIFVTALVITLYALSEKIVHEPGSFLRIYRKNAAVISNEMELDVNSYYIAGIDDEHIYLGNLTNPRFLIVTNLSLTDSQHVVINLRGLEGRRVYSPSRIKIAPPYFYYVDGITPCILRGKIGEWVADRFMHDSAYFDIAEVISPSSFAVRTHKASTLENVLAKVQDQQPHIKHAPDLLQKQIDGVFCNDGMLCYNKNLNRLIYTHYYRNEYIVYDTNLNLDYRGHTIDTFSIAQIKSAYIPSTNTYKLTQRKITNKASSTSGNYLYVDSNLLAKNDNKVAHKLLSIIDVYDLSDNKYLFSFTVPKHSLTESKFRDFQVYQNRILIAIYKNYIVKYDLQPVYFKEIS